MIKTLRFGQNAAKTQRFQASSCQLLAWNAPRVARGLAARRAPDGRRVARGRTARIYSGRPSFILIKLK